MSEPLLFRAPPPPPADATAASTTAVVAHATIAVADAIAALLTDHGHRCSVARDVATARAAIERARPDLLVVGPRFSDGDALELARHARRIRTDVAILLITCAAERDFATDEVPLAPFVDERFDRPFEPARLLAGAHAAVWRHRNVGGLPTAALAARGAPPLAAAALVQAALIVACGYGVATATHLYFEYEAGDTIAAEATPGAAPGWLAESAATSARAATMTVTYVTPAHLRQLGTDPALVALSAPGRSAFEVLLRQAEVPPLTVAADAVRLDVVGRPLPPLASWLEPAPAGTGVTRLYVAFARDWLRGESRVAITLPVGAETLRVELRPIARGPR